MRRLLTIFTILGLLTVWAEESSLQTKVDVAVAKGLAALAKMQREDGSLGSNTGYTSLAAMAFLAGGHTPDRGQYAPQSKKCLEALLSRQDPMTGYLGNDGGNMYAHGFATLFFAECAGMSADPRLRRAIEAALDLIYRSQNPAGGWRYNPAPTDADISVTICQVMAIRAAYNAGIGGERSQETMGRAIKYVEKSARKDGTFVYTLGGPPWSGLQAVPSCAAGIMCLQGAGITKLDHPILGPAYTYLRGSVLDHLHGGDNWYWYGQYYCSQAMFLSPDSKDWDRYWPAVTKHLLESQREDGSWAQFSYGGNEYGTAVALIILQIPNQYLPIYQR
jgi:hypothetical protein